MYFSINKLFSILKNIKLFAKTFFEIGPKFPSNESAKQLMLKVYPHKKIAPQFSGEG